jgi:8-oxo-dGTP pyrophosphatase MutT (NUDIX family)
MTDSPLTRRAWIRLLHTWFLLSRPMTLGVRAIVFDKKANAVLLVRHTYVPGFQLPGGGIESGETAHQTLARELEEEANVVIEGPPELKSFHFNRKASRRDHVALYLVTRFRRSEPFVSNREIAEAAFFPLDALPSDTTAATRRRLAETFNDVPPDPHW